MAFQAYQEIRYEKPSIKVFCQENLGIQRYRELLLGIEEEGLPYEVVVKSDSAQQLAYAASEASRLGVGLGVGDQEVVLHFEKLGKGRPLFSIPGDAPADMQRALGANAARLVKKLPFKSL